jgi:hypothetical protein
MKKLILVKLFLNIKRARINLALFKIFNYATAKLIILKTAITHIAGDV